MRRWTPIVLLAAGGCAYYNGIYNAKSAASAGDRQSRRGETYAAGQEYLKSAAKAETVLYRHPKTRWRADALYFAARGAALGGECARGMRRLDEYLVIAGQSNDRRERALIARASCLMNGADVLAAETILEPLLQSRDADVRAQAALWSGRAALLVGDATRAERLLAQAPGSAGAWEFIAAAFQTGNIAKAESLLVVRAQNSDWRSEVHRHVLKLWQANERDVAIRIVDLYGASRAPTADRVALRFLASDLAAAAGDTAVARRQAAEAQRLGLSPTVDAEAQARLLSVRIREFDALRDVEAAVARDSAHARGTLLLRRINDNLAIMRLLLSNPDQYGSPVFLAAEIARDSLRAFRLAHAMFRSVERDFPEYEIAARALLASRAMVPESTQVYAARVTKNWPSSSAAAALDGRDPTVLTTLRQEDVALARAWTAAMAQWADTLKVRKTADSLAAAAGARRQ